MSTGKRGGGFTLIEVMLTVTVLAVAVVGILRGYAVSVNALEASQYSIDMTSVLKERLAALEEKDITEGPLSAGAESGNAAGFYGVFSWEERIEPFIVRDEYYLNKVTVCVTSGKIKPSGAATLQTYMKSKNDSLETS